VVAGAGVPWLARRRAAAYPCCTATTGRTSSMATMANIHVPDPDVVRTYYQRNAYRELLETEGIPVYEEYSVDCKTLPLEPWPRLGGLGAYVNLTGRSDYLNAYVHEIPAGGQTEVEHHMFDKLVHVVSGRGATSVELPSGRKHTFEWMEGAAFGIPLNAKHQHFNGSGSEPARIAAVTSLPVILNVFLDPAFVFDSPNQFPSRFGDERYFRGEGEFRAVRAGRHQWETNFVPDLRSFELPAWHERGASGNNINFIFADSILHSHISEFDSGTYKKAHFHDAGAHIFLVSGHGYSLLWKYGQDPLDTVRVDWKPGTLYAPPDGPTYHQHFNTSGGPARYLVFGPFGNRRHTILESQNRVQEGADVSAKLGGIQVEYEDEDPRILELFERECAAHGVQSRMREFLGR
jgi:quercetin dioxygenase-like cupin family protein